MLDRDPIPLFPDAVPAVATGGGVVPALRLLVGGAGVGEGGLGVEHRPDPVPVPAAVAPVLGADDPLGPEVERRLTALAHLARGGDRAARDTLFLALGPKIDRMLGRCRGLAWSSAGPRRDGRPWELEDLGQQAYIAFVDLLALWSGEGAVGPYLLAHLPWRLRNAWRELAAPRRRGAPFAPAAAELLIDGSAAADEAVVLLEAWAAGFPPLDGAILLLRFRDGATAAEIAAALGLQRRTLDRRWRRLRGRLRRELAPAGAVG